MKKRCVGWVLAIAFTVSTARAQPDPMGSDSSRIPSMAVMTPSPRPAATLVRTYAVPVALMTAGLITQGTISRQVHQRMVDQFPHFQSRLDDYLQLAPSVAVLGLGAAGVEGRHEFGDQLALLVLSQGVTQAITHGLKKWTAYPRPDHSDNQSFPSGHTSGSFAGATVLAHEYGFRSGWYMAGGYTAATTVGLFRMLKSRHWLADVLFGAGTGIGSTELVYQLYPWMKHLIVRRNHTVVVPTYTGAGPGFQLISVF